MASLRSQIINGACSQTLRSVARSRPTIAEHSRRPQSLSCPARCFVSPSIQALSSPARYFASPSIQPVISRVHARQSALSKTKSPSFSTFPPRRLDTSSTSSATSKPSDATSPVLTDLSAAEIAATVRGPTDTTKTSSSTSSTSSPSPSTSISSTTTPSASVPADDTPELPYFVHRTAGDQLPVYKRKLRDTVVRRISGDASALKRDLQTALKLEGWQISVNQLTNQVIVRGQRKAEIARFLIAQRF